jgi:hypothetical protein
VSTRADRRIALIVGGLLALLFSIGSAARVAGWTVGSVERTGHQVVPGPVRELRVESGSGDITLVPARGEEVRIDSRSEGTLYAPRPRVEVVAGTVDVDGGCSPLGLGPCSSRLVIEVPDGIPVRVDLAAGDVTATALSGNVDLSTSSGDVRVRSLAGRVELETSSGDIDAAGLRAHTVRGESSSGDVELEFAAAPQTAEADTSAGDARIAVPPGRESYRVEVDSSGGSSESVVSRDPSSARLLRARTRAGDALISYTD